MRASIISFTTGGLKLSRRAAAALEGKYATTLYTKQKTAKAEAEKSRDIHYVEESVGDWTKKRFPEDDLLVFIGACAIAVRSIAPVLKDKLSDTPVISMTGGFRIGSAGFSCTVGILSCTRRSSRRTIPCWWRATTRITIWPGRTRARSPRDSGRKATRSSV